MRASKYILLEENKREGEYLTYYVLSFANLFFFFLVFSLRQLSYSLAASFLSVFSFSYFSPNVPSNVHVSMKGITINYLFYAWVNSWDKGWAD